MLTEGPTEGRRGLQEISSLSGRPVPEDVSQLPSSVLSLKLAAIDRDFAQTLGKIGVICKVLQIQAVLYNSLDFLHTTRSCSDTNSVRLTLCGAAVCKPPYKLSPTM